MNNALTVTRPAWLRPEAYPFIPKTFATDEGPMSYVDEGRGPVVLIVHGTPSWSFEWREVVRSVSTEARCIVPDHLGFGLSHKPRVALATADHARRLRALVEHLDLDDVTLVVHDFGGPIGLPLALEGGRIRRVLLMNTWMWDTRDDARVQRIDRALRSPLGRWLYRSLNISPRFLLPAALGRRRRLTRIEREHYVGPFTAAEDREATYALALALRGEGERYRRLWEQREILQRIPTQIVWGMQDPAFGRDALDRWKAALPRASVTMLPEVGHFPAEEDPLAVIAAIRSWPAE